MQRQVAPAVGITQAVYPVAQGSRPRCVAHLLTQADMTQALVFTRTKHRANRLAESLVKSGIKAERIHGNRSQSQRTAALAGFRNGTFPVLVATDIAARGIDVNALGHVVNFDVPLVPEDYIHRVGRTGRAEATGEAFTLVSPEEEGSLRDIERALGRRLPRVMVPDFDYTAQPKGGARDPACPAHRADSHAEARGARAATGQRRTPQRSPAWPFGARPARPAGPARTARAAETGPGVRDAAAWRTSCRRRVLAAGGPLARDNVTAAAGSERDRKRVGLAPYSDPSARLTVMDRS